MKADAGADPWLIPSRVCGAAGRCAVRPGRRQDGAGATGAGPAAGAAPATWSSMTAPVASTCTMPRWPKDPDDPEPRARCAIYDSRDGHTFTEIWSARSTQFDADALEGSLLILPDGRHRLYLSRECPGPGLADRPVRGGDVRCARSARQQPVLTPTEVGAGQVKDPVVVLAGGLTLLCANVSVPGGAGRGPGRECAGCALMARAGAAARHVRRPGTAGRRAPPASSTPPQPGAFSMTGGGQRV